MFMAYLACPYLIEIDERIFYILFDGGLVLLLWNSRELHHIIAAVFMGWRLTDEVIGYDRLSYTIGNHTFSAYWIWAVELIVILFIAYRRYRYIHSVERGERATERKNITNTII